MVWLFESFYRPGLCMDDRHLSFFSYWPVAPDYQFVTGAVSGQVLMSVIDTTMSIAMNTSDKSQRGTLSQNNNFIRPAFGDYFIIESIVQRFGSSIAIGETKVYSEDNKEKIVCHATSTFPLK